MSNWDKFLDSFFNARVAAEYLPKIIDGFWLTILLAACVIATGGIRPLNWLIIFTVDLFRALPPLVIIVLIFFGLPGLGLEFSGFAAAWIALSLVLMAFAEEIYWAGITSVPKGQWEASRSLGLPFLVTFLLVIMPQAIRLVIPPLTNRTIAITKGTALASVVAVPDILGAAQAGVSFSFNPTPLTLGAAAYLLLFLPVVILGRWVETRFAWKR
ncbi:MAG: amino acid ABC transporter permease [Rhodospirillales bacterium]|nr:amino acid ABC transporter permease [Rhodospirillales bacterium]